MKRLVVFDINGFLCRKVSLDYEGSVDLVLNCYKIILRPGYKQFLEKCYDRYTVGFFSSTTYKNANPILNLLLTKEQQTATLFKWFRDRTSLDPDQEEISCHPSWNLDDFTDTTIENHSTVKYLSSIFDCPIFNVGRPYSFDNTLICDDSASKLRFNPKRNCILLEAYNGQENDDFLSTFPDEIESRFEQLRH